MKFIQDILFLDVELYADQIPSRPEKDPIIQLSATLLDKDNLLEKDYFHSYVRSSVLDSTLQQHADYLSIPFTTLKQAPKLTEMLYAFQKFIPDQTTVAVRNIDVLTALQQASKKTIIQLPFGDKIIQTWTLEYIFTLRTGLKKMPTLQTLADYFHLPLKNTKNAYQRQKVTIEVFRQIIQEV